MERDFAQDMLDRPRSSRIFYGGKFTYPSAHSGLVEARPAQIRPLRFVVVGAPHARTNPRNFEDWVSANSANVSSILSSRATPRRFGNELPRNLGRLGHATDQGVVIRQRDPQRFPQRRRKTARSDQDVDQFLQVSAARSRNDVGDVPEKTKALGGALEMGCRVIRCQYDDANGTWTTIYRDQNGKEHALESEHVISSTPMRELINGLEPAVSEEAKRAADSLKYRDFLTVMLILKNRDAFHDNWIYIHDPSVKVGRIQNFRSWSPEMVPDPDKACYGLEYFCFEHDGLWDSKMKI